MQYEYYYAALSQPEKRIYRLIYDALKEFKKYIVFEIPNDLLLPRTAKALEYDHPELYYWNDLQIVTETFGNQMKIELDYFWNQEDVDHNAPKIEKGISSILNKCKGRYDSEYERFLNIYSCMARNITYDNKRSMSNSVEDIAYAHTIYGVFAKHMAVCDGISKALKLVLERSGIDCIVVRGSKPDTGNQSLHTWNIVWIDDKPCHVDLTWAVENSRTNKINYDYVGLTDEQIRKDHQIDAFLDVPNCHNSELDYYVRNGKALKTSNDLKLYIQKYARTKPFEINVRLDYQCDIESEAKRASDFIISRYVSNGDFIRIDYKYYEDQNILILVGR